MIAPILSVLGSCCACVVYLEYLAKEDPGSMNLLTFTQFAFISLEGLIFTSKFFTVKNNIPIKSYFIMVILFWGVNVINNWALSFQIPVPLHIIFRSGSLLANMILGMIILGKRYTMQKYISVVMITIGIVVCTLASKHESDPADANNEQKYTEWLIGVAMLSFALIFSALLGIFQERLYTEYGKHSREALFYAHALPLPLFAFFGMDIVKHFYIFNDSEIHTVPYIGVDMPILWWYLILSVITQYFCIRSVYYLTSVCPSLTVTLVVTLRKFVSLVVSIIWFRNPFTLTHWLGTVFVFGGTLLFADVFSQIKNAINPPPKGKKLN